MSKIKSAFSAVGYAVIGGLVLHWFFTWVAVVKLRYDYNELYTSAIESRSDKNQDSDSLRFARIEARINRLIFEEFHDEFGPDALVKYEAYVHQRAFDPEDVFMQQLRRDKRDRNADRTASAEPALWEGRYADETDDEQVRIQDYLQDELDNHSNQLNPNNDSYWQSRGYSGRQR